MKKNKLLPIIALSGVATIAMPLVASCSCGGYTPEPGETIILNKWHPAGDAGMQGVYANTMDIEADISYQFKVSFENVDRQEFSELENTTFALVDDLDHFKVRCLPVIENSIEVWIGETKMSKAESESEMFDNGGWMYFPGEEEYPYQFLVIGKGRDTSILDDVITINVKFNKPCNLMIPVSSVSK